VNEFAKAGAPAISSRRRRYYFTVLSKPAGCTCTGEPFGEAGNKFVAESQHLRGLDRDERALALLYPFIGSLPLQQVHHEGSYHSCEQGSTRV
jgi:hypothetical protein